MAVYIILLGAGLIVLSADLFVVSVLERNGGMFAIALVLSLFLLPIGWSLVYYVPRSRTFPLLSSLMGPPRQQQPYWQYPTYQYPSQYPYAPYQNQNQYQYQYQNQNQYQYQYQNQYPYQYQAPYQYTYQGQQYQQYPSHRPPAPSYPSQPPAQAGYQFPQTPSVAPTPPSYHPNGPGASWHPPQAAYGSSVPPPTQPYLAQPVPPQPWTGRVAAPGPDPAPWPLEAPPPWPDEAAEQPAPEAPPSPTLFSQAPQPSPYAPPGVGAPPPPLTPAGVAAAAPPAARADGRPSLAIHDFSYYFLAFLAATFLGAGILALGAGIGPVLGLILLVCFIVSFSFPSLMWVAFVHNRRRGEPEPRQGVLTALAGGMLATVLPLFINSFVGALNQEAASVLSAPLVEELSKALVLIIVLKEINSRYDGLIYGVTAGMGFAMMENLTYSLGALASGSGWGVITLVRGLASTVGHGVSAGLIGYAVGAYIDPDRRTSLGTVALAYLGAVGLHGGWNGLLTVASGLSGGAGVVAMACIIGIWPFMEIGLLIWLMDMGRARGDSYEGGGTYHEGPPASAQRSVLGAPGPVAAAPSPQAWYGPPTVAPPPQWPPDRPPTPPPQ